jgi:hypothetical protein
VAAVRTAGGATGASGRPAQAFARLVDDPEFQQAVERVRQVDLNPIPGAELAGYVDRALSTPSGLVGEAIEMMGL